MKQNAKIFWPIVFIGVCLMVILPFIFFGKSMEEFVSQAISNTGENPLPVAGILFILLALDVVLPTPSSIIGTALGSLLGVFGGTLAGFLAMTISCLLGYAIGLYADEKLRRRFISEKQQTLIQDFSKRRGRLFLILFRAVPVLAEASTVFAGIGKMNFKEFLVLCSLGNLAISFVYAFVGSYAKSVNSFLIAFIGAILLPGILMLVTRKKTHGAD